VIELADRMLHDRLEQDAVVFVVLFAIQYYWKAIGFGCLMTVTLLFVALVLGFDFVRQRVREQPIGNSR
jgi:uncharacterized membrane protein YobD (UPF0266 family)